MNKHTPGPWLDQSYGKNRVNGIAHVSTGAGEMTIDCTRSGKNFAEDCANARLIAAAPKLLEALEAACNVLFLLKDEVSALGHSAEQVPITAREAIAEATGAA